MGKSGPVLKSRRILVYRIGQLGDTVIALPALRALRRQYKQAHMALLSDAPAHAHHALPRQVLPVGLIDEWLTYPSSDGRSKIAEMLRLWRRLRSERFDTLAYLAPRLRNSFQVKRDLAFFRAAGIKQVIGHKGIDSLAQLGQHPLPNLEHETDHLLQRLARSGIEIPPLGQGEMNLALTEDEQDAADSWLRENVEGYREGVALVGVGPGSKWPSKIWPAERFLELGRRLSLELGLFPVVFGGSEDAAQAERLIKAWGRGANAAGALDIRTAAAALARCQLYVGNDTGTMHLAAAVGTSCVVVMSAQDWPGRWHPYGARHTVLRRSVPCEGCMLQVCTREGLRCLKEIEVEDVLRACRVAVSKDEPQETQELNLSFR
jgi:heptosyltransferase-3